MKNNVLLGVVFFGLFFCPLATFATSWAYPFITWEGNLYVVTDTKIEKVEEELGQVTSYSDMESLPGDFSNAYQKGTKFYKIKGVSTEEAIAVEVEDGTFIKAIREESYLGESNSEPVVKSHKLKSSVEAEEKAEEKKNGLVLLTMYLLFFIAIFSSCLVFFVRKRKEGE
ncbi:hypothetical protein [Alkalihalobacillus sp. LMS39]|uniref:hypothetical protein n=1 Tax=Alkalihalobacillus sp. LMS39 TaxID=2924032 RepID=UPI001FB4E4E4|nr:hypothetical protein [Alkalihalobacillus sp. LMS39]UOE94661.1 hypothetical protein MM271_03165 [Alkalihalobacillus sp. LMS39]